MRIADHLYFAPNVKFSDLDLTGDRLAEQYNERMEGFYLTPAELLAEKELGFAAGLLILCCIDSLSNQRYPHISPDRERYKRWVQNELRSFKSDDQAYHLYDFFRNGLVHESCLKKGVKFSFEQDITLKDEEVLCINPLLLLEEVRNALTNYVKLINADKNVRKCLQESLLKKFKYELNGFN